MPRETIRRLSRDVERVLVAGAHLAAADGGLAKGRAAIDGLAAQLGAKAPVITQLAAATAKAVGASGAQAARELVALATMTAQVRCAQAQPVPAPVLAPLTATPALGTPCDAKDLGEIYVALVERGKGRMEVIREFTERGDIADLRLVDALVYAMSDSWIGEMVTTSAIPRLGPAIVAPIRALLDVAKGRIVDGRRLRALVAVQKAGARDLLTAALTTGNAEMREAAFDAVADHLLGDPDFEALVLEAVQKERVGGVRRAALRAIAGYASDISLEALVEALDDTRTLIAAGEGLGASRHPKVLDRMLARLTEAVALAKKPASDASAAGTQVAPKAKVEALLGALAKHRDPRIAATALALIDDYGPAAAAAALKSADPKQLAHIADRLGGTDDAFFPVAATAAVALGPKEVFARFSAAFTAKDREGEVGQRRLQAVASRLHGELDGRWPDFCLKQLGSPGAVARYAMPLLGALKDRRALKSLLKHLTSGKDTHVLVATIHAMGAIGDPAAIDPILTHVGSKEWPVRTAVRDAILAIGDVSSVATVRGLFATLKTPSGYEHWHLRSLLQQLEQRFPGK